VLRNNTPEILNGNLLRIIPEGVSTPLNEVTKTPATLVTKEPLSDNVDKLAFICRRVTIPELLKILNTALPEYVGTAAKNNVETLLTFTRLSKDPTGCRTEPKLTENVPSF
jgi:hypothetical protein